MNTLRRALSLAMGGLLGLAPAVALAEEVGVGGRLQLRLGGKIGLDATNKWPPETRREWGRKIRMADDVVEQVTRRWSEYGLPGSGKPIWK